MKFILISFLSIQILFAQPFNLLLDGSFSPKDISGLYAWYDASKETGTEIATLTDQTGNGRNLANADATKRPELSAGLNSKVINFMGADSSDYLEGTISPTFTKGTPGIIAIFELEYLITLASINRWGALNFGYVGTTLANYWNFGAGISSNIQLDLNTTGSAATVNTDVQNNLNVWTVIYYELDYDGNQTFVVKGSRSIGGTTTVLTSDTATWDFTGTIHNRSGTDAVYLGARTTVDNYTKKNTAEILFYVRETPLTDSEKREAIRYFYDKWRYY